MTKTDKLNELTKQLHQVVADYRHGWIMYSEYMKEVQSIQAQMKELKYKSVIIRSK